jgi:hypothetical protein
MAVRCRVLLPDSTLQEGVANLHVDAGGRVVGRIRGRPVPNVCWLSWPTLSRAQLLTGEPVVLHNMGGRRVRWCALIAKCFMQ